MSEIECDERDDRKRTNVYQLNIFANNRWFTKVIFIYIYIIQNNNMLQKYKNLTKT